MYKLEVTTVMVSLLVQKRVWRDCILQMQLFLNAHNFKPENKLNLVASHHHQRMYTTTVTKPNVLNLRRRVMLTGQELTPHSIATDHARTVTCRCHVDMSHTKVLHGLRAKRWRVLLPAVPYLWLFRSPGNVSYIINFQKHAQDTSFLAFLLHWLTESQSMRSEHCTAPLPWL